MKKLLFVLLLGISCISCATSGRFIRAEHNGKIYWLPPDCNGYQPIFGTDNIMCFGIPKEISPTPNEEYETYLKEQSLKQQYNTPIRVGSGFYTDHFYIGIGYPFIGFHHHRHRKFLPPPPRKPAPRPFAGQPKNTTPPPKKQR